MASSRTRLFVVVKDSLGSGDCTLAWCAEGGGLGFCSLFPFKKVKRGERLTFFLEKVKREEREERERAGGGVGSMVDAALRRGRAPLSDARKGAMTRQGVGDVRSHGAPEREKPRSFTLRRAALAFADWEGPYAGDVRGMATRQGGGDVRGGEGGG